MTPRARRGGAERRLGARLLPEPPLVSCNALFGGLAAPPEPALVRPPPGYVD